jgi:hypothetical protein
MPTPPNFSSWRHFHGVLLRTHNPIVKAFFDTKEEEDRVSNRGQKQPSISQIRTACLIQVNDSAIVAAGKITLFNNYITVNQLVDVDFYAIPIEEYHEKVRFKPQIMLLFRQAKPRAGFRPLESRIGFRWREEDPNDFHAERMAVKIDNIFGWKTNPFRFDRGTTICSYVDPPNGYRLKIYASTADEGRKVVQQVLDLQDDSFDKDFFASSHTDRDFRDGTKERRIYGEWRKEPRERPEGEVTFYRAELKIWGVKPDVTLVDYSGRRSDLLKR